MGLSQKRVRRQSLNNWDCPSFLGGFLVLLLFLTKIFVILEIAKEAFCFFFTVKIVLLSLSLMP